MSGFITCSLIFIFFSCGYGQKKCLKSISFPVEEAENKIDPDALVDLEKYHYVGVLKYYTADSIVYDRLEKRNGLISFQRDIGDLIIKFYNQVDKNVFEYNFKSPKEIYRNKKLLVELLKKGIELRFEIPKQCLEHRFEIFQRNKDSELKLLLEKRVSDAISVEPDKYFISNS